ncbi:MAG: hypothetical protein LUE96_05070 [Lachnospiraceae bacterium]|nr:hypothetical protein [Lachnospiraceae bacterium]
MAVSLATLQVYDQYLTTYRGNHNQSGGSKKTAKHSSRYDTHNPSELQNLYTAIQWKNRFAPLYLSEPSPKSIAYAIHLKESAQNLKHTIGSLSGDNNELFATKTAYSDNEALASVEYVPEDSAGSVPESFELEVDSFASPQINTGKYLPSDQPTDMAPGNYSFDILTNKLHYEIQFNINEDETNSKLQNKLARLVNSTDIGVSAKVIQHDGLSALELTSDAYGLPYQGERHFTVTDEDTGYDNGVVDYLGLNDNISKASNAVYSIDGKMDSSYSNSFNVYDAYHVTLHPESGAGSASIGLYTDAESLSRNIESFVDGYNHFLSDVLIDVPGDSDEDFSLTRLLSKDMTKFVDMHKKGLAKYGISVKDDSSFTYSKVENVTEVDSLKSFGNNMMRKLTSIALDPMEYVDRRICAYPNPFTNYINPYMTSIYTGLLFNTYT